MKAINHALLTRRQVATRQRVAHFVYTEEAPLSTSTGKQAIPGRYLFSIGHLLTRLHLPTLECPLRNARLGGQPGMPFFVGSKKELINQIILIVYLFSTHLHTTCAMVGSGRRVLGTLGKILFLLDKSYKSISFIENQIHFIVPMIGSRDVKFNKQLRTVIILSANVDQWL